MIDETTQKYPLVVIDVDFRFSLIKLRLFRNYVVRPTFFLMNVFIALKGSHFWFYICAWQVHCMILWLEILMDQNFLICLIFLQRQLLDLRLSKAKMLIGNLSFLIRLLMNIRRLWSKLRLRSIRGRVESGNITVSRGLNRGETKFVRKKGLLYRQFAKGNKVILQLVVPEGFREKFLRLAHETLLTENLGIKKTLGRVLSEFFFFFFFVWSLFCKSCDICQRTNRKGRVTKVPLGKLPLIDTPFKRVSVQLVGPVEPRSDKKSRIFWQW